MWKNAAAAAAVLVLGAGAPGATDDPPIGSWRFDEGEGAAIADSSGNGRSATVMNEGQGVRWVKGRRGGALEFTGGDPKERGKAGCVRVPDTGGLDFAKGLTVELWVKFTKINRPATYELVSNTFSDRGKGFRLNISWLSLRLKSGEGGAGKTWGVGSRPAKTKIEAGVWYHVAATYDGSAYRVYLDGLEVAANESGLTMTPGRPVIYIGSYSGGYAYGLDGVVDDVRIYDYPRTPRQILAAAKFSF